MSSSSATASKGSAPEYFHPRARKVLNSSILKHTGSEVPDTSVSNVNGDAAGPIDYITSGTSTPVPIDAPSSVQAISSARKQIRAQQKQRMFPTVEYATRVSHFDKDSEHRDFRGFFVLFWVGLAIMVVTTALRNYKETGSLFPFRQRQTFFSNFWEMVVSDVAMTTSTLLNLPLHKLYAVGPAIFRWRKGGIWIQSAFQAIWFAYWIDWPFIRNWTWTAQVFFTLHCLTLAMKVHSWAFYNGHLNETKRRLDELDHPERLPVKRMPLKRYPSTSTHIAEIKRDQIEEDSARGKDAPVKTVTEMRDDLAVELTSPMGKVTYPQNLTLFNYLDFLFLPTLCFELEYPRTQRFRPMELFYKTSAVFGCVFLLTLTSEGFIMPVLDDGAVQLQRSRGFADGALILAETTSRLLFPFMVTFLLVFLVIFEYVLNAFAEITGFADRHFYDDWWNSENWLQFSREWNIPVHNFFRRHVYSASRSLVSRPVATFITFFISALAHELIMGCITRKLRGYGFFAMMMQMPIVLMQRSKLMRGRTLLNNILFWCSMILGLSMMCALYVLV